MIGTKNGKINGSLCYVLFAVTPLLTGSDWPEFRGPTHDGKSRAIGLPTEWREGKNVVWKTPIHDRGWSSPVVQGSQVWLTTATTDGQQMFVICVDRDSGKILYDEKIFHNKQPRSLGNPTNSYATPSPVVEPGRVYVHFGSYGTACLDTETFQTVWQRRDLPCDHWRGPASSPVLFEDLILLHFDGADVQYAAALDKHSGNTRWVTFRSADYGDLEEDGRPVADGDYRKAYNTPYVFEHKGQHQMLSPSARAVYSYDPRTGEELWHVRHDGHSSAARTLFVDGLALAFTGLGAVELLALNVDGRGDVTDSHVAWRIRRGVPERSSPILVDNHLYMVTQKGVAACLDLATQKLVWQERIGGKYSASMVYVDGHIYFFDEAGVTTVIRPGKAFHRVATNRLEDGFMASPAIAGRAFILRTRTHLYRVESAE